MKMKPSKHSRRAETIPPRSVVRVVAGVMLIVNILLILLVILYFSTIGLGLAFLVLGVSTVSAVLSLMALKTGDPEWLLLDLILPG